MFSLVRNDVSHSLLAAAPGILKDVQTSLISCWNRLWIWLDYKLTLEKFPKIIMSGCHKPQGLIWLLHVWRSRSIPDQLSVHSVAATATGSIHLIKMKAELLRLWSERSEHNCTADLSTYCCRNRIIMVLTTGIRRAKSPTLEWLDAERWEIQPVLIKMIIWSPCHY